MSAAISLQVNEDAEVCCTDHHTVVLQMLCETLTEYGHNSSHSSTSDRVRYDDQSADAYEEYLTVVLHSQWWPLMMQSADVDVLSMSLADLALEAARETTPQAGKRRGDSMYVSKPWYDGACKDAYYNMKHVLQCHDNTAEQRFNARKKYKSVTCRVQTPKPSGRRKAPAREMYALYLLKTKHRPSRKSMGISLLSPFRDLQSRCIYICL